MPFDVMQTSTTDIHIYYILHILEKHIKCKKKMSQKVVRMQPLNKWRRPPGN